MKHRILLEFSADTLPDDFLDQIAGRVYGHPAVEKKECTAAFVGDVLKDAERYQWLRDSKIEDDQQEWICAAVFDIGGVSEIDGDDLDAAIDAAKDTQ